jgi:hypothetical protein
LVEDTIPKEKKDIERMEQPPKTDDTTKQMTSAERLTAPLTKIKIATRTGVRSYAVGERTLEKYGRIPNRLVEGMPVYARRIKVFYPELGVSRNIGVAPEKREEYFYNEDIKQFTKYVPEAQTQILLRDKRTGKEEIVTTTQEKVKAGIYGIAETRGKGKSRTHVYERQKNIARRAQTKQEQQEATESGLIPAGFMAVAIFHMTVTNPTGTIIFDGELQGYSVTNREPRSEEDMINGERGSALSFCYNILRRDYGLNDNNSQENNVEVELISHVISKNLS